MGPTITKTMSHCHSCLTPPGLMTVAEITKLALGEYVRTRNRVFFDPGKLNPFTVVTLSHDQECICRRRDPAIHRTVLGSSHFEPLSTDGLA